MKANNLKQLDFDKNVGGGMKNIPLIVKLGINNVTMGRIEI